MARIIVLEDIEATADGMDLRSRLSALVPTSVQLDFGRSQPDRAMLALRLVDAVVSRFVGARFAVTGRRAVRRLLSGHLHATGARLSSAAPSLVVDVAPGVRQRSEWIEGAPPVLRVASVPYPGRRQHAAEHWLDSARAAGLLPERGSPCLRIPKASIRAAHGLLRDLAPSTPVVILAPRSNGWSAESYVRLAQQLEARMGARVLTLRPLDGIRRLEHDDPLVLAAAARLASVVVGDAGGYCDIAAVSAAAVVALHGRTSSARYGPTSRLSASVLARCKLPEEHHASASRELRCLRCLEVRPVLETTEELAARRWPWDRLARWIGEA